MDNNILTRNRLLSEKIMKGLESRNITAHVADTKEDALKIALELIPTGSSVAWGGSASVEEIGLSAAIRNGQYTLYERSHDADPAKRKQIERQAFSADYFLCSCNAITEDGILVNIDGNANRVAAIAYGPDHVIMVVGMNKVTKDVDAAISRARNTAAPRNVMRFPLETPCKTTGSCANCKSMSTICCQFLVTRFSRHPGRIHVILVNDNIGY